MSIFHKVKGGGGALPPRESVSILLRTFVGSFVGILMLFSLSQTTESPWLAASFGSTCVLLFATPYAPSSQPRCVIGGHFITTFIAVIIHQLFGSHPLTIAFGLSISILVMMYTRTLHPSAGGNPLIVLLGASSFKGSSLHNDLFILTYITVGAICLVLLALIINNLGRPKSPWPVFWLGLRPNPKRNKT